MIQDRRQHAAYETAYADVDERFAFPDPKILEAWDPPAGARILSIGAGAGRDIWHLTRLANVHAVDFAATGLRIAHRHNMSAVRGDVSLCLPYRDASFDLVILKDILEHLVDPEALAREAKRVLRTDGSMIISIPNHFYLPFRLRLLFGRGLVWKSLGHDHTAIFEDWNYMHLRFFTYRSFRRFLQSVGLVAERYFWDFGTLAHYNQPEMILGAQMEKRRLGLPLSRRGRLALSLLLPAYRVFNTIFPRWLRRAIVGVAPGLLCAGFYVRCRLSTHG